MDEPLNAALHQSHLIIRSWPLRDGLIPTIAIQTGLSGITQWLRVLKTA